jgi:hypothetical protein
VFAHFGGNWNNSVTVGRAKRVVSMYAKAHNLCGNT